MRFIIFGVGAVGGGIAAGLVKSGRDVIGIARGKQLAAIRDSGLRLRTPDLDMTVHFECTDDPATIALRDDDVILLCVKTQDTEAALKSLREAGAVRQPVFCMQNGVANEAMALRHFEHVYGVTVMMPCAYQTPGEVLGYGTPKPAIFDIGRYPKGSDATAQAVADALDAAGFKCFVQDDVMASKYGKLLLNLRNVLDAAFPDPKSFEHWAEKAHAEAVAAYRAAGIQWVDVSNDDPRRIDYLRFGTIDGAERLGSSSMQSLMRGTGSIETDYLNGEIVLIGRRHGVPTPLNAALCRIGQKLVSGEIATGKATDADIEAELTAG